MLFNHLILCHPLLLPSTIPSIRVFSMSHRIIGTLLGLAFWDWNENWPFLILWPLLSFPNLLTYWVQHLNASFITSPCMYYLLSHVQLFVTPWTVTCQAPESVHGILQARIQEWVAILFSRGSSQSRNRTQVSWIAGRFFTVWATNPMSLFIILYYSAFSCVISFLSPLPFGYPLSSAIFKGSLDNHFAFLHFFLFGMILVTTPCMILWTSAHSSSGTLSTRYNALSLFFTTV